MCLAKLAQKLLGAAGHDGVSSATQTGSVTGTLWVLKSVTCTRRQRMINLVMVKCLFLQDHQEALILHLSYDS